MQGLSDRRARYTFPAQERDEARSIFRRIAQRHRRAEISASVPPARCNCSTSAGGRASAWSRERQRHRQPLLASTFYLTRALSPFADVRLGDRGAPQLAITQFLDQKLPMIVNGRCRNAVRRFASASTPGSNKAACWCASPVRARTGRHDDWCR